MTVAERNGGDRFTRMMLAVGLAGCLGIGVGAWRLARTPDVWTTPSQLPRTGSQIVAIYIGSSDCRGSKLPGFADVEHKTMDAIARMATRESAQLLKVGVSVDAVPRDGIEYLRQLGPFDVVSAGGGWVNPSAVEYIWREMPGDGSIPQIIVLRRSLEVPQRGVVVSADTILGRLVGIEGMQAFLAREARRGT